MAILATVADGMGASTISGTTITNTGMTAANHMQVSQDFITNAGVVGATDLVTSQNGSPNMSVNVTAGTGYILNASYSANSTSQNKYWRFISDGTVNATIAASDPSNPRIDLVCAKFNTSATPDGTASNVVTIISSGTDSSLKGTAAGSPSAPAVPSNYLVLAQVAVAAGATSIVNANLTGRRVFFNLNWVGKWTEWTPTWSGLTVGNGTTVARYEQLGKTVNFYVVFTFGTTTSVTSFVYVNLPTQISANMTADAILANVSFKDSGTLIYDGVMVGNGSLMCRATNATYSGLSAINATVPHTWTTGDAIVVHGSYESL